MDSSSASLRRRVFLVLDLYWTSWLKACWQRWRLRVWSQDWYRRHPHIRDKLWEMYGEALEWQKQKLANLQEEEFDSENTDDKSVGSARGSKT